MNKRLFFNLMLLLCLLYFIPQGMANEVDNTFKGLTGKNVNYGGPNSFAEFHGFMDLQYFDFEKDGKEDGQPRFDLHAFYLSAKSSIRENIFIYGEVEYEHGGDEIKLEQAYIDWGIIADRLNLRIGQFFVPFGIEKTDSSLPPLNKMVSRPFVIDDLAYGDWKDIGLETYGLKVIKSLGLSYDIALLKGPAGLLKDNLKQEENNQNKMIMARFGLMPALDSHKINMGVSWASSKYDNASAKDLNLIGVDARFITEDLDLRGEYIARRGDDHPVLSTSSTAAVCTLPNGDPFACIVPGLLLPDLVKADASGYYIQAAFKIINDRRDLNYLETVFRYDVSDIPEADNRSTRFTAGLNYSPYPHLLFKGEYQFTDENNANLDNDGFILQAVADF